MNTTDTDVAAHPELDAMREKFDDDEWFLLSSTPSMIGAAMSTAAPSGIIGTIKEISASMRSVVAGKSDFPDNVLIQALLEKADNWDEARERMQDYRERARERINAEAVKSREDIRALVLEDCRSAAALVTERCTAREAEEYKLWSVNVANGVAEAAKEGSFLGFGGVQVSEEERQLIADIEAALGAPSGRLMA